MKKEIAYSYFETGEFPPDVDPTLAEVSALLTGACLQDNGDIWCCRCHRPNETCICYEEKSI